MAQRSGTVLDVLRWKNISYLLLFSTNCHTEEWVSIYIYIYIYKYCQRYYRVYEKEKRYYLLSRVVSNVFIFFTKNILGLFHMSSGLWPRGALALWTPDILTLHLNLPHRTMKNREHLFGEITYRMSGYSITCPCLYRKHIPWQTRCSGQTLTSTCQSCIVRARRICFRNGSVK